MSGTETCKTNPLTIDEAIAHAEAMVNDTPCGQQHRQLADWLKELKNLKSIPAMNNAAMREALENLLDEAKSNYDLRDYPIAGAPGERGVAHCVDAETIIDEINSALSKPARNCDLFGGDKYKLHSLWYDWTGTKDGVNEDGTVKLTFGEWLLEEAYKEYSTAIIPDIELVKSENEQLRKAINHIVYYIGEHVANRMTDVDFTVAVQNEVAAAKGKISCQVPSYKED